MIITISFMKGIVVLGHIRETRNSKCNIELLTRILVKTIIIFSSPIYPETLIKMKGFDRRSPLYDRGERQTAYSQINFQMKK